MRIAALPILTTWHALGGGPLHGKRGKAFWRDGDGFSIAVNIARGTWFDHRDGRGGAGGATLTFEKAKPAGASGGHREFLVTNWKAHKKNTLQGFLSIALTSGLAIHNCTLHSRGGSRWIGVPARQYTTADGATSYAPLIEFDSSDARQRFQAEALEAVDRFMEDTPRE